MSQALYRKWRPARFDQVIGQDHVTSTLRNAVAAGRLGHAYLFSGPRGTGKTTIARLVAKAANCRDEDLTQRPCDKCPPCLAVTDARYLDLIEIDAASNTGVDDIRDLREKINFAPSEGRFKVYIIDEVHMLSAAAFNALLKTLEEPPEHAMFVLATTEEHKVPLTIKSRCQIFTFRLLTGQEISGRLRWLAEKEGLTLEEPAVALISQNAAGSLRDAESLLDQLIAAPGELITLKRAQMVLGTATSAAVSGLTDALIAGEGSQGLAIIHEALATGTDARQFSRQLVSYLRQLLIIATAGHELTLDLTTDQAEMMNRQAMQVDRGFLIDAVKGFNTAAHIPTGSWQPQLPLELAFIELLPKTAGHRAPDPPPTQKASVRVNPVELKTDPPAESPADSTSEREEELPDEMPSSDEEANVTAALAYVTLDSVKAAWPNLRDRVGKRDSKLRSSLSSIKPLGIEGQVVILGFDFALLQEKFEKKKDAKEIVSTELGALLHSPISIRTVVTGQYTPPPEMERIDIKDFSALAEELGGVVHSQGPE